MPSIKLRFWKDWLYPKLPTCGWRFSVAYLGMRGKIPSFGSWIWNLWWCDEYADFSNTPSLSLSLPLSVYVYFIWLYSYIKTHSPFFGLSIVLFHFWPLHNVLKMFAAWVDASAFALLQDGLLDFAPPKKGEVAVGSSQALAFVSLVEAPQKMSRVPLTSDDNTYICIYMYIYIDINIGIISWCNIYIYVHYIYICTQIEHIYCTQIKQLIWICAAFFWTTGASLPWIDCLMHVSTCEIGS